MRPLPARFRPYQWHRGRGPWRDPIRRCARTKCERPWIALDGGVYVVDLVPPPDAAVAADLLPDHYVANRHSVNAVLRRRVRRGRFDDALLLPRVNGDDDLGGREGREGIA